MLMAHDFIAETSVVVKTRTPQVTYSMAFINDMVHSHSVPGHIYARYNPPPRPEPRPSASPPARPAAPDQNAASEEQLSQEQQSTVVPDPLAPRSQLSDEIFARVPLLAPNTLLRSGMHVSFLPPGEHHFYSSTGAVLIPDDPLRRKARYLDEMDNHVLYALDKALWPLLRALFIMKDFRKSVASCSAMHAYQLLSVLLFNRVHLEKNNSTPLLGSFYLRTISSCQDLVSLMDDFYAYTVIHNVLHHSLDSYDECKPLLGNLLDGLKRAASKLPVQIQADFLHHTRELEQLHQMNCYIHPPSVLIRLGPILQLWQTASSHSIDSAFSAASTLVGNPSTDPRNVRTSAVQLRLEPSEAALMTRADPRLRSAPDHPGRRDPNHDARSFPDRRDHRQDDPREFDRRAPSSAGPPERARSAASFRPSDGRPRNRSPSPDLAAIQKTFKSFQSSIDKLQRKADQAAAASTPRRDRAYVATELPDHSRADSPDGFHYAPGIDAEPAWISREQFAANGFHQVPLRRDPSHLVAVEYPSSYGADNAYAMGALHIDPASWSSTFPRADVDSDY